MNFDYCCCPVPRSDLRLTAEGMLECLSHGETYPVLDGIPILLGDDAERNRVSRTNWEEVSSGEAKAIDFYNQVRDHDQYCREKLDEQRADIERWVKQAAASGPALEIGSGKGPLQGIGGDYVAMDYSFTAVRRYVDPKHGRVCGTAERLPFRDGTFRFVFSIAALEHVPNADRAFDEIHRVLKQGGVAYLCPAWHCTQYNCDGIPVRPYRDLNLRQKLVKATLPVRKHALFKAAASLPHRCLRRASWWMNQKPTTFRFTRLRPEYERFWLSDSDAASRLDSHEAALYFRSRGYEMLEPGASVTSQLLARHVPIIVRKLY